MLDRQTGQKTDKTNRWNYTYFGSNLAMMVIYVPAKFEFDWTNVFELESVNENLDGQTNGQKTD